MKNPLTPALSLSTGRGCEARTHSSPSEALRACGIRRAARPPKSRLAAQNRRLANGFCIPRCCAPKASGAQRGPPLDLLRRLQVRFDLFGVHGLSADRGDAVELP